VYPCHGGKDVRTSRAPLLRAFVGKHVEQDFESVGVDVAQVVPEQLRSTVLTKLPLCSSTTPNAN
jgi:hypothetical protein